jgi:hypothetical protein
MVRHDDELVKKNFLFVTIMEENFQQELGSKFVAEEGTALPGNGGDEKRSLEIHSWIVETFEGS